MNIEEGAIIPPADPALGGDGGQNGGGGDTPNPFFESFSTKYGIEAKDETSFYSTVEGWKSKAEVAAQKESEANDWKQKFEGKQLEYETPIARDLDIYTKKLKADGVPLEQLPAKIAEFWKESQTDYRGMAEKEPMKLMEMSIRKMYADMGLDDKTVSALAIKEAALPAQPNIDDFDGETDPAYVKAKADFDTAQTLFNFKAKKIADEFEKAKPKADFQPTGMMTKEQIDAQVAKETADYQNSFNQYRDKFDGLDFGGVKIPFKFFDEKGSPTPEFAPVLARMNTDNEVVNFVNGLFLEDGKTVNGARVAELMMRESPELQAKIFERAKSDALKEYEMKLKGNGQGFGGGGGNGGTLDPDDPDYYKKLQALRTG